MNRTRCVYCKRRLNDGQRIHTECIDGWAELQEAKARRRHERRQRLEARLNRSEIKRRKEALKTRRDYINEAQRACNDLAKWTARVYGYPCISCGRELDWSGNKVDAGHYRSIGSAPHLRFDEHNIHAQCKHCNQFLSGNVVAYRQGLIDRIGLEAVEDLEADQSTPKYTIDQLKAICADRKLRIKELKSKFQESENESHPAIRIRGTRS